MIPEGEEEDEVHDGLQIRKPLMDGYVHKHDLFSGVITQPMKVMEVFHR